MHSADPIEIVVTGDPIVPKGLKENIIFAVLTFWSQDEMRSKLISLAVFMYL